jgi:predicted peptidase
MQCSALSVTLLTGAMVMAVSSLKAQPTNNPIMQQEVQFKARVTKQIPLNYLLYLPRNYDQKGEKHWPLVLYLHGAGERGTNLTLVATHGPPKLAARNQVFPFIIVSPQCPSGQRWEDDSLIALLDHVTAKYKVDTRRVYLTGLSMGGYGTWSLAVNHPGRFAAAAPICGGGNGIDVLLAEGARKSALQSLPIWAFHGAKDTVVPVSESERMIGALKRAGCNNAQLTVYPEAEHDSYTQTYDNPKLYEWFLGQQRK